MRAVIGMLGLLLAAGAAAGQERPMTVDEVLDRLVGNSAVLTWDGSGASAGTEYFPDRDRTFFLLPDGSCVTGEITEVSGLLCFSYEELRGELQCFASFEGADGRMGARSVRDGSVQWIEIVEGLPFDCVDGLTV